MSSPAQIAANRANAQLSTGPTSETGKAKSSLNAVKTGLTGRTVLLPGDDAAAYQTHIDRIFAQWEPSDDNERSLTQTLSDTEWRLLRIPTLEAGIYALGRLEFKEKFSEEPESVRASLIDAHTFLTYRKDLNNLSVQEGRLLRMREKTVGALKEMQQERRKRMNAQVTRAATALQEARRTGKPFNLAEFGFEISIEQVEAMVLGWIASRERNSSLPLAAWEQQFRHETLTRKKAA